MGFFSNLFKGITKFLFPRQVTPMEEEIIEPSEYRKKIVKTTGYSYGYKSALFSFTWENNNIDRFGFLQDKIIMEFGNTHGINNKFGYDGEMEFSNRPPFTYPQTEEGME